MFMLAFKFFAKYRVPIWQIHSLRILHVRVVRNEMSHFQCEVLGALKPLLCRSTLLM